MNPKTIPYNPLPKVEHNLSRDSEGQGMDRRVTPFCSCGWKGYAEYAHNDYMYSNLTGQEDKHLRDIYITEQSKRW